MNVEFERSSVLRQEQRQLPANLYKNIRLRLSHHPAPHLFVPIRSMQYLAVIDNQEIVFVDGRRPRFIELAWQRFLPNQREDLISPVAYTCSYYDPQGEVTMQRLQNDFFKALNLLETREAKPFSQRTVLPFASRR